MPSTEDYDDLTNDGTQDQGVFLVEYASGKGAEIYPEGTGKLLPANQKARVSYHLHSIGESVPAGIELGIVFHPEGVVPRAHPLVEAARAAQHRPGHSRRRGRPTGWL